MDYILVVLYVLLILPPWWALIFLIPFYLYVLFSIPGAIKNWKEERKKVDLHEIIRRLDAGDFRKK